MKFLIIWGIVNIISSIKGDTPANCTYGEIQGEWIFLEGERESKSSIVCSNFSGPIANTLHINLRFPNVALDNYGNKGFWTIVYNQGFEIVINYRKYFAFSYYEEDKEGNFTSSCDRILPGWSHDVLGNNWACYTGHKRESSNYTESGHKGAYRSRAIPFERLVHQINRVQRSWKATVYPDLLNLSMDALIKKAGGLKSQVARPPKTVPVPLNIKLIALELPEQFDWRNVNGVNYVSPVRNQGECGSCYAFSSLAMLESRLRIMTNNTLKVSFSPQDIVSCSKYSQGCMGGFPFVTAGKYAQDFGAVSEECYPYKGHDYSCNRKHCKRYYVANYKYIGGFYGGCNEELMKIDLIENGPLTVAFQVYPDFMLYKSGIYQHTRILLRFNPFHLVSHGVLITGYGIDNNTGEKFWIVKNSWGTNWGENGYFRIRRGTNECSIESMAVSAIPIP